MIEIAGALGPVFLLIVLGYGFRKSGFLAPDFWRAADRLTYFVLFPALLAHNLATAELAGIRVGGMVAALAGAVLVVAVALIALRPRLVDDGPAFTSLFQGSIRPNTYVGLAAAAALFGPPGVTMAAVAIAALVPLVNILSAAALSRYAGESGAGGAAPGFRAAGLAIVRNPLVLACALGVVLNWAGIGLPFGTEPVLDILGTAALPLGLLSVGAGLHAHAVRGASRLLVMASAAKLVVLPALAVGALAAFGITGLAAAVAVLFAALPTSATSYVMARHMGGDHELMAGIITVETACAVITLPAWLTAAG